MAIKASAAITLSSIRDLQSCTRYYLLRSSTAAAPAKPTANPPGGGWVTAEPGYTEGSTSSLYFCDLNLFSDGDYAYSEVSLSSSYEAAKAAYNKASAAQSTANGANAREQTIYISKASGTKSMSANTTWVTNATGNQNVWTTTRPVYNGSYPVLFVAVQRQTVAQSGGTTCSCTTPTVDQTTTVIDGGHITTGSIDAGRITTGSMSADRISGGTLTLGGENNQSGTMTVKDANGNTIGTWNNGGIDLTKGSIMFTKTDGTGDFIALNKNGRVLNAQTTYSNGSTTSKRSFRISDGVLVTSEENDSKETEIYPTHISIIHENERSVDINENGINAFRLKASTSSINQIFGIYDYVKNYHSAMAADFISVYRHDGSNWVSYSSLSRTGIRTDGILSVDGDATIGGTLTLNKALTPANGGTGQTSLQATRNAMGLGNTTGALPVANGGTGATSVLAAQAALLFGGSDYTRNAGYHNSLFRGKSLGSSLTAAQSAQIQAGTFDDLFVGDYWTIGGVNWRIADFDPYYRCGDNISLGHHIAVVPDTNLYSTAWNDTDNTAGGYVSSKIRANIKSATNGSAEGAEAKVIAAFGSSHVLSYRNLLPTTYSSGNATGWAWKDVRVELMNEMEVFGSQVWIEGGVGGNGYEVGISKRQLSLFRLAPQFMNIRAYWWLRGVDSANNNVMVTLSGSAASYERTFSAGVRPLALIA